MQSVSASAQRLFQFRCGLVDTPSIKLSPSFFDDRTLADSLTCIQKTNERILALSGNSFLLSHLVSMQFTDTFCEVKLKAGASFKWIKVAKGNLPEDVLTAAGWREYLFYNTPFNYKQYTDKVAKMLHYLEQNGYPFAQINLDSVQVNQGEISAKLMLDKGDLIKFDTIEIIGDAHIKSWYVAKYLGIKKDAPYNEELIKNAANRLSQLSFVQSTRSPFVYFLGATAKPVVYLTNKRSSSFDGIIGFAPASNNNSNKLLVTGEVNVKLQNLFATGKGFDLTYKSFLNSSQELRTKALWPYIFKTNVGVEYELNLIKFDSTFIDVKQDIGLQYRFIGNDYLKVFYSYQTTSLLRVDTNLVKVSKALPTANDLSNNSYGIGGKFTRYDYLYNPRKGFGMEFNASVGVRKIERNAQVDALKFAQPDGSFKSIYDTMQLSTVQYRLLAKGDIFIPIAARATIRVEGNFGHLQVQNVFFSELFRIGGIRTLKGFDEQAIFASTYAIVNTEIRYLLQQNSHVLLFWNGAWYTNKLLTQNNSDKPYGFGAGLNFETGAGIFSLYYAVGKQFNNSIEFDKAKIHFGFVNYF